jgi:PAS domain S-box-containing protein
MREEPFRSLVEAIIDYAIFVMDDHGRVVTWNSGAEQIKGYSREEIVGQSFSIFYEPREIQLQKPELALKTAKDAGRFEDEGWRLRKDGSRFWANMIITSLNHSYGRAAAFVNITRDVTERKQTEDALHGSEQRFRRYFELGLIGMAITSPTKAFLEANDELCRILGYDREELKRKTWAEITHPDDLAADTIQFNHVMACDYDGYTVDKRWIRKDGRVIHTVMTANCMRRPDGSVDYFVGLVLDTTERRIAEERLHEYEKAVEGLEEMIVVIDRDYRYRLANRSFLDFRGLDREHLIGKGVPDFMRPDVWGGVKTRLDEAFDGNIVKYELRCEYPHLGERDLFASYFPIEGSTGVVDRVACVIQDITEKKHAESELRKTQEELAHVSRVTTLGELTASIAHEVNQPLGAIVTNGHACLRLLSRRKPDLESARECVESMISDGMRASEVIKRIRALLRKSTAGKSSYGLNETIQEVIAFTDTELEKNAISLTTDLAPHLPLVMIDRVQLQQVVMNLILNSIEAMNAPGWEPRDLLIRSEESRADEVMVTITDTGTGIDPAKRDLIFEPFFTTKPSGLGLGLSISRTIIEAHGGRLWITPNRNGRGATFQFTLPVNQQP